MDIHSADTSFNPYRPPENEPQDTTLSPDTEFMVSSECVLCGANVTLPEVCIRTGDKDELERQSDVLKWSPFVLHRLRVVLLGFGLPFAAQVLIVASQQPVGTLSAADQVSAAAWLTLLLIVVLTPVVLWFAHRTTRRTQATWYVERGLMDRQRRKRKAWKVTATVLALLFFGAIVLGIMVSESYLVFTFWTGLPAILSLIQSRRRVQPQIVGTHQGLNILAGLSPLFLQEVLSIIERRSGNTL
jgi:hypothetical protein